jgi:hypothetical protein
MKKRLNIPQSPTPLSPRGKRAMVFNESAIHADSLKRSSLLLDRRGIGEVEFLIQGMHHE